MSGTQPWAITLAGVFRESAAALFAQIQDPNVPDATRDKLDLQQKQFTLAATQLVSGAVDGLLAQAAGVSAALAQATTDAQAAAARIGKIAAYVGLAASLLSLATAVATAVSTGSPGSLLTAAQGVITAAGKL